MSNIVVIIDPAEEAALRGGGVLPQGLFRSFDEIRPDGTSPDDHSVYIWPYPVDYSKGSDTDEPVSLPAILGLPEAGDEELVSESYIARLFGSDVFHVVFLETDTSEPTRQTGFTGRKSTFGSLEAVASWSHRLKKAIEGRLSAEQSKLIRHHLVLVARGGQVVTTQKEAEKLEDELTTNPCLCGCYFLDFNLEVEQNNILLHSKYVWPVMVGRLLLRFLLENTQETASETADAQASRIDMAGADGNACDDSVRSSGVHLWLAREFLFKYPTDKLGAQWRVAIEKAYKAVSESTSITQSPGAGGKLFNGKDMELQTFFQEPDAPERATPERPARLNVPTEDSWDDANIDACVAWVRQDARWAEGMTAAAVQYQKNLFALSHRSWLPATSSGNAVYYSPQARLTKKIFGRVDDNPAQIFFKAGELEIKLGQSCPSVDPFSEWGKALKEEQKREAAKDEVEKAAKEMKAAQEHFVPIDLGLWVVGCITLFCGFAIHRAVFALGCGLGLSLVFSGFVLAGALAAMFFVHWRHGLRGQEGLEAFVGMCNDVDDAMERRNGHLFDTVAAAAKYRELSERRNAMAGNLELLRRVRRILEREIQMPAVSVFYLEDESSLKQSGPDECKRQLDLLQNRTSHFEDVAGAIDFRQEDARTAQKKIEEHFPSTPERRLEGKFFALWRKWCEETDKGHWGNYPARFFIPRLRRYMQDVCDQVSSCLKEDVLDKRKRLQAQTEGGGGVEPLPDTLTETMDQQTGFTYASAHVDDEQQIEGRGIEILYVAPRFMESASDFADRNGLALKTSRSFAVLPHFAFYFRDIPVHLHCETHDGKNGTGRLSFSSGKGK